jgi:hypothetical protein
MVPLPPSRRALYRVTYPIAERPAVEIGRAVHDVIDCSEQGLRYEVRDRRVPKVGSTVSGTIRFRYGESIEIVGEVIRTRAGLVALSLENPGIPFAHILAEQRYLRGKGYTLRDD